MSEIAPLFHHKAFTPKIEGRLSGEDIAIMKAWKMPTTGEPIPTMHNAKAAIWYALAEGLPEIPVLSVVTPFGVRSKAARWFIGLSERYDYLNKQERLQMYADAAQYISPNGIHAAISGLRRLMGDNEAIFNDAPDF